MTVCQENLHHAQKLQKQAHNKSVKPRKYVLSNKVWLNNKYIKAKQKQKLKVKFFRPFQVLPPAGKQAYKLQLLKKWRVYNVFHVLLLEQDTTRKGLMSKKILELDAGNKDSEEYKVEAICESAVNANKSESGHLLGLYYLVAWKSYPEEENTWEPLSAV